MDSKKICDTLDENLFSNKIFNKCYFVYALMFVVMPLVETLFHCVGFTLNMFFLMMFISTAFAITKFLELTLNFRKINLKNKTLVDLFVTILLLVFIISSVVNGSINISFVFGICYFLIFVLFFGLDKKHYKLFAIVFVGEMVFDSVLGLVDLKNKFIPGFDPDNYAMSMQFLNPNWSAVVVILASILSLWFIYNSKKHWQKLIFSLGYFVMIVGLFVGGSYAPEAALFLCELALVIYLWVKNKKCPWLVLCVLLGTIFISFFVWMIPIFRTESTAHNNFFYESLAVIDNNLGTSFVKWVSSIFDELFGFGAFDKVLGSDGWTRNELTDEVYAAIFANPKSFIFGYGSGFIYSDIRVHDCFLVVWMEFGIFAIISYLVIIVLLTVRFIKIKKNDFVVFMYALFLMLLHNQD